ncbi:MAG: translation initiation factor IF-2 subunit gamma, partial [Candidatus Bathyarchaeia archaeon]
IHTGESVLLDVGTTITVGNVTSAREDTADLQLARPICAEEGARAALSRKIAARWRLIGYGIIK